MSMEPFPLDQLNKKLANFRYVLGQEEVESDHMHFRLGNLSLSVVGYTTYSSWNYAPAGVIFESDSYYEKDYLEGLKYSEPILVKIKVEYYSEEEGHCTLAFLDPDTKELVAYLKTISPRWEDDGSSNYCVFKVLRPDAPSPLGPLTELEQRLLM